MAEVVPPTADALGGSGPADPAEPPGRDGGVGPSGLAGRSRPDRRELGAAVSAVAAGGGLALLATARTWSTVTVARAVPLGPLRVDVTGRTLQPAVTGLAVVALAGVLALLATRAVLRQAIGVVLALAGAGMIWRGLLGLAAVPDARARQLVLDSRTGVTLGAVRGVGVAVDPGWIVLAVAGGALVLAGGALTVLRGGRWRAMSARYESPVGQLRPSPDGAAGQPPTLESALSPDVPSAGAQSVKTQSANDPPAVRGPAGTVRVQPDPTAAEVARARADLALWHQLDRGEDPTAEDEPAGPAPW